MNAQFHDVPPTPRGHLGLLFYEAAYRVIYCLRRRALAAGKDLEATFERYPFLLPFFQEIRPRLPENIQWSESVAWLHGRIATWEREAEGRLPLLDLVRNAAWSHEALLAFIITGMVEEQGEFAALFAELQEPLGHRRPTLGLLRELLHCEEAEVPDTWELARALLEPGVVEVVNRDAPRSEWVLRVPPAIWTAARGQRLDQPFPGARYFPPDSAAPVEDVLLDPILRDRLSQLDSLLRSGRTRAIVLRGPAGCDRLAIAGALAARGGFGLLAFEAVPRPDDPAAALVGPFCVLAHAIPAFSLELGPGESVELPRTGAYRGPIVAAIGHEGGIAGASVEQSVTLNLEAESAGQRTVLWSRALNGRAGPDLARIAETYPLPGGRLRQVAQLAGAYATLARRETVTLADVREAARSVNRQLLDSLATHLADAQGWAQLVVGPSTEQDLRLLESRCRHRERLAESLGASVPGGLNKGVRAIFEGPSGTGKTLAARILAAELGLDLYRVDLASVINKYIGETEKNLSRVLSRAEDLGVILLLDEGDALMSRRTDVRSANDRWANLQTDYLLQRLENYNSILIVTTNAGDAIDSAFRRRMDVVVKFHLPDAEQRWQLWTVHLPRDHALDAAVIEETAVRYPMTGGQIRTVSVHATLLALDRGDGRLNRDDLLAAIRAEHRKSGAACPSEPPPAADDPGRRLEEFLGRIT